MASAAYMGVWGLCAHEVQGKAAGGAQGALPPEGS